ncbi:MAG: hypothetical protein AB9883_07735 [Acidaminococcaceae bacterium]
MKKILAWPVKTLTLLLSIFGGLLILGEETCCQAYCMLRAGLQSFFELWPIKLAISIITTAITWLFGTDVIETVFLATLGLIVVDTLTKWAAITRRFLLDNGTDPKRVNILAIISAFPLAWQKNYLESAEMRLHWGNKLFSYMILAITAALLQKFINGFSFSGAMGQNVVSGIYMCIALTEAMSILENLEAMGNTSLGAFKRLLVSVTNRVTGGTFSMSYSPGGYGSGGMLNADQIPRPISDDDQITKK